MAKTAIFGKRYLLQHLKTCCLNCVPQHDEKTAIAVDARNEKQLLATLEKRLVELSGWQWPA